MLRKRCEWMDVDNGQLLQAGLPGAKPLLVTEFMKKRGWCTHVLLANASNQVGRAQRIANQQTQRTVTEDTTYAK